MYSVIDTAGSNHLLHTIFENAAATIVDMTSAQRRRGDALSSQTLSGTQNPTVDKPTEKSVAITMFGVTTPCVDAARAFIEEEHGRVSCDWTWRSSYGETCERGTNR